MHVHNSICLVQTRSPGYYGVHLKRRDARVRESAAVRSTEQASTPGGRCWEANQSLESLALKAYEGAAKKLYEDLSLHIGPR